MQDWDKIIRDIKKGHDVGVSWDELVRNATTEQRVSDLVSILDEGLERTKQQLLKELEMGGDVDLIEKELHEAEQSYRIARGEFDILYFTYEYFSEDRNEGNDSNAIPSGVSIDDAPAVHKELCHTLHVVSNIEINKRIAQSMPRGHGKSLYLSNVFPIHQIVYRKRRYILIVSETESMARKFVAFIKDALKFNEKLRKDFGQLMSRYEKANLLDNAEAFETFNNVYVQSASTGKQLRGARYKQFRPDLVICDDLESAKNTNTPELRERNLEFFNKTLMPIGTPENTAFVYMGTMVHGKGLLPHVLERADFSSRIYSAIVRFPEESADLWNEFENIYSDRENPNRLDDAIAFYEQHKEEMDADVQTLWESRFPYHKLIMEKVNIGSRAFSSEFLNKPSNDEDAIFKESTFVYFDDSDLFDNYGRPINLEIYSFWDMAIGKNQKSDYNAIVTIGKDRRTGIIYVLDAWAKKIPMHKAKQVALEKIAEYRPHTFGVETIQAQYEMYRQLQADVTKAGLYHTRIKPYNPRGRKEDRIGQLEPIFENGAIRIKRHHRLLIEQLTGFLNGAEHDDLPDALASCVELAGGNRRIRTYTSKPMGL